MLLVTAVVEEDHVSAANLICALCSMSAAGGAFQSYPVTFHMTGSRPSSRAMRRTAGRRPPKGGRKRLECSPIASSRAAAIGEFLRRSDSLLKIREGMGEGVIADDVSGIDDFASDIGTLLDVTSDQKESCVHSWRARTSRR